MNIYWKMWITLLYLATCSFLQAGSLNNDILGFAIPAEPDLDVNTVCKTFPELTPAQYRMCSRYPDVAASAIQGIQIAIHECQYQFRGHRWNCSSLETKNKNPQSSPLLGKGYRETAFAYAISAAGMTSQVSRACSLGKLRDCGCARNFDDKTQTWTWSGCSENIEFGEWFTRKFIERKERRSKDLQSQINLHNNRAGRLSVRHNSQVVCKCHGMSGSCEVKTCWKQSLDFRKVGHILKQKYYLATQVKVDNTNVAKGQLQPVRSQRHTLLNRRKRRKKRHVHKSHLVFFERSPSFCEPDNMMEDSGTKGRYCNKTSSDIDNCETLCCGRGYDTLRVTRTQRCHCKFHWCCYVICKNCTVTDWVTVCK